MLRKQWWCTILRKNCLVTNNIYDSVNFSCLSHSIAGD